MRIFLKSRALGTFLGLLLFCSCATTPEPSAISSASELPAEVAMNKDAGRGNWLFVMLRLQSGEELPFFLDTGATTFFDKALEPKLGKRLSTKKTSGRSVKYEPGCYVAPKLFLGNTPLMIGHYVWTRDLTAESSYAGHPIMGVLGIDCLRNYCIQLDFQARKIRFLDPNHLDSATLGKALPLTFPERTSRPFLQNSSLLEAEGTKTLLDTGYDADAGLNPQHFGRELREGTLMELGTAAIGRQAGFARLPNCVWNGGTYTNLIIGNDWNALGLRFLARHLVTLNFPKGKMYLKQISIGPLVDEDVESGIKFLMSLKEKGQLPGWSKDDHGEVAHARSAGTVGSVGGDSGVVLTH